MPARCMNECISLHAINAHKQCRTSGVTLSWYITGLQLLYITSLVTYYKQITDSLLEQGVHTLKLQLA